MSTLETLTAAELAGRFRTGETTPEQVCEHLLERIRRLNPTLAAVRLVDEQRAMQAAHAATAQLAAGIDLGPLHGIPYLTKDLFDVAGMVTTAGSHVHRNRVASADATVTRRLAAAGAVLLGKTTMVEFAFGSVGVNHSQGTPHNPWSEAHRVPGGSSSGSAVALAAGMTTLATGTDTACSVRTPASLCGVVGLKTTVGRISRHGAYPLSPTLDSVGPLTRSVEDAAVMLDVLQGPDPADLTTRGVAPAVFADALRAGVRGLRVGIAEGLLFSDLDPDVERAVRAAAEVFRDLGAVVEKMEFVEAAEVMVTPNIISRVEGYAVNAEWLQHAPDDIDPVVRKRILPGADIPAYVYLQALNDVRLLQEAAARRFDQFDVLLAPTCNIPAALLADVDQGFDAYMGYLSQYLRNCFPGNLLNLCGISVPCGLTSDGLPIGVMLYGAPFREDMVLRAAWAYEQATPWHHERPDLSWLEGG